MPSSYQYLSVCVHAAGYCPMQTMHIHLRPPVFMATIIDCRLSNRALHVCASGEVGMVLSHQLLVYVFSIAGCLPVNKIPQVVCMQRTEECEALNYALFTQYTVLSMILYVHVGYLHSTQN